MAYSTINKSSLHFNTKLYTGTGSSGAKGVTGVGFQPDFLWIKNRSAAQEHWLADAVRGTTKFLESDTANAESSDGATGLASFDSDGFTLGTGSNRTNQSGSNMVAWNWKAAGSTASNSSGSITSTVSANTTAGFSIVSYTGTAANATVGHGLGAVPKVVITKSRVNGENWGFYHENLGNTKQLVLNTDAAETGASAAYYNNTSPTSTVFSVGTADSTNDNQNMIAYCFAEKTGYSKFGSYTGNGVANGTFIYLGFKPAFLIIKQTNTTNDWFMWDNKTSPYNVTNPYLRANTSGAAGSYDWLDLVSNGIKIRNTSSGANTSGGTYIYMAFGQSLVGSNNVPATAR